MSMIIRKKQIVTVTLVLALGTAVFVNWYFSRPGAASTLDSVTTTAVEESSNLGDAQYVSATTAVRTSDETMSDFKVKRDKAHDEAKETLNSVIKDQTASSQAVTKAVESLDVLTSAIKDEADLENLLKAKISKDCLVIIDDGVCQVIAPKGTVTDNVSLQIKELVMTQTKISSENITIIELNG